MYEYIQGRVDEVTPTYAVIDAGGVGYYINISLQSFTAISALEEARLYIHYIVREDAQILYGFYTKVERDIFRSLLSVSGVGGNTARMILSTYTSDDVIKIISTGQAEMLKSVKGLGLKTAQKIIVELRDKLVGVGSAVQAPGAAPATAGLVGSPIYEEAATALQMLGFAKSAADKVLRQVMMEQPGANVETIIRTALKRM